MMSSISGKSARVLYAMLFTAVLAASSLLFWFRGGGAPAFSAWVNGMPFSATAEIGEFKTSLGDEPGRLQAAICVCNVTTNRIRLVGIGNNCPCLVPSESTTAEIEPYSTFRVPVTIQSSEKPANINQDVVVFVEVGGATYRTNVSIAYAMRD